MYKGWAENNAENLEEDLQLREKHKSGRINSYLMNLQTTINIKLYCTDANFI